MSSQKTRFVYETALHVAFKLQLVLCVNFVTMPVLHSQILISTVHGSQCTLKYYTIGCALQTHSSKVTSIVPYPGVLQRPLAAGYYSRANCATVAHLQCHPEKPCSLTRRQKSSTFLAPSQVHVVKVLH